MKLSKQNKRDAILVFVLLFLIGSIFAYREWIYEPGDTVVAYVYYGNDSNPLVTIDFNRQEVVVNQLQPGVNEYPIINTDKKTITVLGDYEVNGQRQEVVIQYDLERKTVQIIEESSPYNVCSKQGESDGAALICLPNSVRVEFSTATEDFVL